MTQAHTLYPLRGHADASQAEAARPYSGLLVLAGACWLASLPILIAASSVPTYVLCVCSLILLLIAMGRHYGLLDYRSMLVFSGSLYAVLGTTDVLLGDNLLMLDPEVAALNTFVATAFLLAFGGLCLILGTRTVPVEAPPSRREPVGVVLLIVGVLLPSYLYYVLFVSESSASRVDVLSSSSAQYAVIFYAILTGLLVVAAGLRHDFEELFRRLVGRGSSQLTPRVFQAGFLIVLALVLMFTQFVLLGNRREILSFLAALLVALGWKRPPLWTLPLAALLFWFSTILPWLREAPIGEWIDIVTNFSTYFGGIQISNTEHAAFAIIADVYYSAPNVTNFPTMLDAFGTLIPRSIWPDRPIPAGEWFVATFFPNIYRIGGGLAYNFPMETVMNLGLLGPLVVPACMAALINRVGSVGRSPIVWRAAIVLAWLFWLRYDFATLLKSALLVFPFILFWLVIQRSAAWVMEHR